MSKSVILGTAGHIDHGKSALVKALTGTDPDRLKEEKERGITIDIGFASLYYPQDDLMVSVVDVPGHERLIRNMLAGAGGIDVVLMVIAADEGVMPQSREHLAICELLKIKSGIVVITKSDLVDSDWLNLVIDDVRDFIKGTFLEGAEIVPVSSKTGYNINYLKEKIRALALKVEPKLIDGLFRLPIDRVFTLKGFGTVVTGTALSGVVTIDSPIEILPAGIKSKVRGLQVHGRSVERAQAGQRIGLNLQGVDKNDLKRGDVVVEPHKFSLTRAIDATLELLKGAPTLKNRSLVHFYLGTFEGVARIVIYDKDEVSGGESCLCQFRLQNPIVTLAGDRYIVRRFSPLETIGGGQIIDPFPRKRKKGEPLNDLIFLSEGSIAQKLETKIKMSRYNGLRISDIEGWINGSLFEINKTLDQLVKGGVIIKHQDQLFHKEIFNIFKDRLISILTEFHRNHPLKVGLPKEELKQFFKDGGENPEAIFSLVSNISEVILDKDLIRLKDFNVLETDYIESLKRKILSILNEDGFQPPLKSELSSKLAIKEKDLTDVLKLLTQQGLLIRINDSMYITKYYYDKMLELLKQFFSKKEQMTVAEFRDILKTTRKYALPILEYLDSNKITLRVGEIRKFMLK
ncbi:MAG: selenocysteine-specific translation elongation factor [Thermodesulfovibrionales bacterium]|nr:selenocysteine-specific translation elongation factor [Thermodesulfovibrionales bacterium]